MAQKTKTNLMELVERYEAQVDKANGLDQKATEAESAAAKARTAHEEAVAEAKAMQNELQSRMGAILPTPIAGRVRSTA